MHWTSSFTHFCDDKKQPQKRTSEVWQAWIATVTATTATLHEWNIDERSNLHSVHKIYDSRQQSSIAVESTYIVKSRVWENREVNKYPILDCVCVCVCVCVPRCPGNEQWSMWPWPFRDGRMCGRQQWRPSIATICNGMAATTTKIELMHHIRKVKMGQQQKRKKCREPNNGPCGMPHAQIHIHTLLCSGQMEK